MIKKNEVAKPQGMTTSLTQLYAPPCVVGSIAQA